MLNELMLASQSVQALGTLLKAASGLANYNEIVAKVSEVNTKLMGANAVALGAQEKQAALAAKVQQLESELASLKDWQAEAHTFEVREVAAGVFAYLAKVSSKDFQSAQKFCANCFDQGIVKLQPCLPPQQTCCRCAFRFMLLDLPYSESKPRPFHNVRQYSAPRRRRARSFAQIRRPGRDR